MRTIRFSWVSRNEGSHFLITDDAIIWHSRHFPDSDRRSNAEVQQKRWGWAAIDRFEFVPVPENYYSYYFKGLKILGFRILRARDRYGARRRRRRYWLCAWPTAEVYDAAAAERLPWPRYEQDTGRPYSLRVWRARHVEGFTSHRQLFEGKYWVIAGYHGFSRRRWWIIARAVRKRSGAASVSTSPSSHAGSGCACRGCLRIDSDSAVLRLPAPRPVQNEQRDTPSTTRSGPNRGCVSASAGIRQRQVTGGVVARAIVRSIETARAIRPTASVLARSALAIERHSPSSRYRRKIQYAHCQDQRQRRSEQEIQPAYE